MNEEAITGYIRDTFAGVEPVTVTGTTYYFYDPEQKFPFVTLVTDNAHDSASNLDRPGVFRLNIGGSKETYRALFGSSPAPDAAGEGAGDHDFTALDRLLPHPVYGRMHWVCVLNPTADTFATTVQPLLAEAYAIHVRRYAGRVARA